MKVNKIPLVLVLRYLGVNLLRPGGDAAGEVAYFFEPGLAEEIHGFRAAASHLAVGNDLTRGIKFADALRKIAERDEISAEIGDLIFVGLADVEHEEIFAGIETALQLFGSNVIRVRSGLLVCGGGNAAELLVVDQLRDRRMRAASRALGIFAQLQSAEAHGKRVDHE